MRESEAIVDPKGRCCYCEKEIGRGEPGDWGFCPLCSKLVWWSGRSGWLPTVPGLIALSRWEREEAAVKRLAEIRAAAEVEKLAGAGI